MGEIINSPTGVKSGVAEIVSIPNVSVGIICVAMLLTIYDNISLAMIDIYRHLLLEI